MFWELFPQWYSVWMNHTEITTLAWLMRLFSGIFYFLYCVSNFSSDHSLGVSWPNGQYKSHDSLKVTTWCLAACTKFCHMNIYLHTWLLLPRWSESTSSSWLAFLLSSFLLLLFSLIKQNPTGTSILTTDRLQTSSLQDKRFTGRLWLPIYFQIKLS